MPALEINGGMVIMFLVVVSLSFVILYRFAQRRLRPLRRTLEQLAKELGGEFVDDRIRWFRNPVFRLRATIKNVHLVLECVVESDEMTVAWTRSTVKTDLVAAGNRRFTIAPKTRLLRIAKAVIKTAGLEDLLIGDPQYDAKFMIKASDPTWLQTRLSASAREQHLRLNENVVVALAGGELTGTVVGTLSEDPIRLRRQMELVAEFKCALS